MFGNVRKVVIPKNFKSHNIRNVVTTTGCTERGGVPCLKLYLKVRITVVRCTHRMYVFRSTRDVRLSPGAARPIVTLVPSRGKVRSVKNALELNSCPYMLSGASGTCRMCNARGVDRHRHRHCRIGGSCEATLARRNVGLYNASPSNEVIRVVRVPRRP